ncbi:ABC-F family ATP-binding cassette domain-containing protein [Iamia sp.]|uniref:ABC-F family ATP-binding cassette domain-containing protein n=1 Tax=Iamia sp. TaxID=2722710 RepID=UPI002BE6A642|nr:ABC-F family ATP-binding cassette domain-containing protein [Iamia sp.]HXH57327.1 ABC-F family ATP-binding cassette domain-containing protein [Iamia sp.]
MILLDADGVTVTRPERPLFTDVDLTLASGDRLAVVGLNGCGKSTLLRVVAGEVEPASGTIRRGRGSRVVAVNQDRTLPPGTVRDAIGAEGDGAWLAEAAADRLGLTALLDRDVSTLSGGEMTRTALARALTELGPPGGDDDSVLLILDEPTNHLDIDAIAWLEERLAAHRGGLLLVTHDRHVLDRVTTRILEIDRGHGHGHDGGYASYLEAKAVRSDQAASAESVRRNLARRELAWLRRGAKARSTKAKARVDSATALVEARPEAPARASDDLPLHHGTPRLGDQVVELHGVGHRWDEDREWLFRGVDLSLARRERLGLVGPNGAGKSTLVDVIAGRLAPAEGRVVQGSTARVSVYDQTGITLDPGMRVAQAVAGAHRDPDWSDAALLEAFWFDGDAQRAPISLLSGGERRRLQLLLTLRAKPNVLLLDEPTNDLDLDTLRVLEDFLDDWPGALVVVSHDRAFLERTVADVLVIDERTNGRRLPGGYEAWEQRRRAGRTKGRAAATSAPIRKAPTANVASSAAPSETPTTTASRRPKGHLHKLMKEAEGKVRRLDTQRAELTEALAAGDADHRRMAALGAELARVEADLATTEDEWLALADEADR